jgi:tetratricopeptide (TPR) repeat protein
MLAAAAAGLRAAWSLQRRGAPAEAGYAASFSAAFGAWALAGALNLTPRFGAGAWLSWAAAGMAAGMVPLARPRGAALALPLPFGEDVRRLLQYPAFMVFACLLAWPGGWLASDVRYNRALAEARSGRLDAALADAGRVWPGSSVYPPALYLRGRVLMDQGKPQEALDAYARLDGVAPDFSRVHARRAEAYAMIQDWPSSARERRRQADLTPLDLANLTAWAEASRAAGDMESARLAAARAQALAPGESSVRTQLAANALIEKRRAAQLAASKRREPRGLALKPKTR